MFLIAGFESIIPIILIIIWVISQVSGAGKEKPAARRQQQPRRRNPQGQGEPAGGVDDQIQQFLLETTDNTADVQIAEPLVLERVDEPVAARSPLGDLGTSDISQRGSRLGSGVRTEERQLAARRKKQEDARHAKFDHNLGQLEKTATTDRSEHPERLKKPVPKSAAAGVAAMIADGESLRDAIIFSEIINPPTDRW
jgi:hypothetical protein